LDRALKKFREVTRRHGRYKRSVDRSLEFRDHGAMNDRTLSQKFRDRAA